uniref:Uncharacterized protein n=1 Tax=Rhizophora mucronata TaxID=61149 RepID=A0A2P2MNL0_RHIMU
MEMCTSITLMESGRSRLLGKVLLLSTPLQGRPSTRFKLVRKKRLTRQWNQPKAHRSLGLKLHFGREQSSFTRLLLSSKSTRPQLLSALLKKLQSQLKMQSPR